MKRHLMVEISNLILHQLGIVVSHGQPERVEATFVYYFC